MGVAKATLDQIAERAGVSKGTIYLYFANKEELFRQTIREALSTGIGDSEPGSHSTATRQLVDTVARYLKFLNSETVIAVNRLVSAEQTQFPELAELYATEVLVRFKEELSVIIERGIEGGEFREADPATSARMLTALTVQSASWANSGIPGLTGKSTQRVLGEVTEFFLQAMAPEDASFAQADGAPARRTGLNN